MNKRIASTIYSCLTIGFLILATSCHSDKTQAYDYGTQSDSARNFFVKGWEEIMDNGRWTESEEAFRKAVENDSEWVLGKSLLGRITQDPKERRKLIDEIENSLNDINEDELLLVEVNLRSIIAAANRDEGISNSPESTKNRRKLAELNFGKFVRKYPNDKYFKAEYIEILHANHGAKIALDSLNLLTSNEQKSLLFFIRYNALLELELGNIENAKALSNKLSKIVDDPSFTSPLMLNAQIYYAQDSLMKADELVGRVIEMDSNHLIAQGLQQQITRRIDSANID